MKQIILNRLAPLWSINSRLVLVVGISLIGVVFSGAGLMLADHAQAITNVPFNATETSGFVPCGDQAGNPCTVNHLFAGMIAIINYLIATAGFIAVAMIVLSGLKMIWARGDSAKLAEAKGRIGGAVMGIILVSLAFIGVNALFTGSFSLGVRDGFLILTDPIQYISQVGSQP